MLVVPDQPSVLRRLRRRVVLGNVIGYAGMVGVLLIFFSDSPTNPLFYGLAGAAVGSGTGLAYLSLLKIRQFTANRDSAA